MSILTLGCDGRAVMNVDNILDLSVPIMTVATRKNDFGPVQIEVRNAIIACTVTS